MRHIRTCGVPWYDTEPGLSAVRCTPAPGAVPCGRARWAGYTPSTSQIPEKAPEHRLWSVLAFVYDAALAVIC